MTGHLAHYRCVHFELTITGVDAHTEQVRGSHLRQQRRLVGLTIRDVAQGASLSRTRIAQLEQMDAVSPSSAAKYLGGIVRAWKARADEVSA